MSHTLCPYVSHLYAGAINGLFRSRTDYSLDKLAAGELLAQGYSPTLQKMYASQCSVDCPLVGSIEQLDYLRNVLGLEVVIKLNAVSHPPTCDL